MANDTTRVYLERWHQTFVAPHAFPEQQTLLERQEFDLETAKLLQEFWRPTGYVTEVGFPGIEAELRRIGAITYLPRDQGYCFGIVQV